MLAGNEKSNIFVHIQDLSHTAAHAKPDWSDVIWVTSTFDALIFIL